MTPQGLRVSVGEKMSSFEKLVIGDAERAQLLIWKSTLFSYFLSRQIELDHHLAEAISEFEYCSMALGYADVDASCQLARFHALAHRPDYRVCWVGKTTRLLERAPGR